MLSVDHNGHDQPLGPPSDVDWVVIHDLQVKVARLTELYESNLKRLVRLSRWYVLLAVLWMAIAFLNMVPVVIRWFAR